MDEHVLTVTRRSLHAVAEQLLAGPQHRTQGTIRLRITPGGFGQIAGPWRVDGGELVGPDQRVPLSGTIADIARAVGVEAGAPTIYADHADLAADASLDGGPCRGGRARQLVRPGRRRAARVRAPDEQPVLWPEHFDLGIAVDEVNSGSRQATRPRGPVRLHRTVDPARGPVLERRVRLAAPRGRAARRRRGGRLLRRGPPGGSGRGSAPQPRLICGVARLHSAIRCPGRAFLTGRPSQPPACWAPTRWWIPGRSG